MRRGTHTRVRPMNRKNKWLENCLNSCWSSRYIPKWYFFGFRGTVTTTDGRRYVMMSHVDVMLIYYYYYYYYMVQVLRDIIVIILYFRSFLIPVCYNISDTRVGQKQWSQSHVNKVIILYCCRAHRTLPQLWWVSRFEWVARTAKTIRRKVSETILKYKIPSRIADDRFEMEFRRSSSCYWNECGSVNV